MTHPDFSKAAAHVTAEAGRDTLAAMVDISSPTGREAEMAKYLVHRMRGVGLDTDLQLVDEGRPNAVGHLQGAGCGPNLLLTGHMDTSYSGDEDYLVGEGFRPKAVVRDGWLWGLGAKNMKTGLAPPRRALDTDAKTG